MGADGFLRRPLMEQVQLLYTDGQFVIDIRYYRHKINLYLYANNYYEVFVNHKDSRIEKIQTLDYNSKRMKFYTDQLQIQENRVKSKKLSLT